MRREEKVKRTLESQQSKMQHKVQSESVSPPPNNQEVSQERLTFDEWKKELIRKHLYVPPHYGTDKNAIELHWVAGGQGGGSCWSTSDDCYHPITADPEPEFEDLDAILEAYWPEIGFLQYKRMLQKIIKTGEDSYSEYYGNYTVYATKTVYLYDLYNFLIDNNRI